MANLWSVPFSFRHQFAFGPSLSKYPSGEWLGTLKYMMSPNLFVPSASSTASRLIQGNWYSGLAVGEFFFSNLYSRIQPSPDKCASLCPGKAFADVNIWLAVASITACFRISSNGALGEPKFTSGLVS